MAYHHGNLRQALIDAAVSLVHEHGPDAVSVRQVARLAGVSSGAPFRHFADKTGLMIAVAEDGLEKLSAEMLQVMSDAPSDPAEQFRSMGMAYILFAVHHPAHFRVMHRPAYSASIRGAMDVARAHMRTLIVAGQEAGTVAEGDPERLLLTAQALVYGTARMFVDGLFEAEGIEDSRAAEIADQLTAQLGIGLSGGRPG